jgi:hypothetical protein
MVMRLYRRSRASSLLQIGPVFLIFAVGLATNILGLIVVYLDRCKTY